MNIHLVSIDGKPAAAVLRLPEALEFQSSQKGKETNVQAVELHGIEELIRDSQRVSEVSPRGGFGRG